VVKKWAVIILVITLVGCDQKSKVETEIVAPNLVLIPKPSSLIMADGFFEFQKSTVIASEEALAPLAEVVQSYLFDLTTFQNELVSENQTNALILKMDTLLAPEEYQLTVTQNGIEIIGGEEIGVMHGFQTLRQVLLSGQNQNRVPVMTIRDQPRFQWRGLLLDCSRHFMEKDFVKRYIDLLALYKMNVLHWHLTEDQGWRIEIKKYPKLTEVGAWRDDGKGGKYGGFYTQEDIKEIVQYAQERGVTVVPEIELPGHSQAALAAYPALSCTGGPFEVQTEWGVFKDIYCAGNDSTFQFLEDVLTEVIALFPSKYILIGGDAAPKIRWEQCDKCQNRIKTEGLHDEHELQSYFIKRIEKFLNENDSQIIGWDEILEGGLAPGATVQSWRGFEGAAEAAKSGHQAIVSPTSHAYFDYAIHDIDMEKVYDFEPVPEGLSVAEAALILGGECNMWSERAPQHLVDSKVFPRMLAMAEVLWSDSTNRNYNEFTSRVQQQYKILDKLGVKYGFEKPPLVVTTKVVGRELMVEMDSYDDEMEIYYALNQDNFTLYEYPVGIDSETNLAIILKKNEITFPDTTFQKLIAHNAIGIVPKLTYPYNRNYTAGGESALLDGKKGGNNFRDGNWQGYWASDAEVIIDLGESKTINHLSTGFIQYNNAWIFFPDSVEYSTSLDGKVYKKMRTVVNTMDKKEKGQIIQDFQLAVS